MDSDSVTNLVKHLNNPAAETIMANLSDRQIKEFKEAFKIFDRDGNGTITTNELGSVMRSLGQNPTELEIQDMVNEYDVDGNGKIDFGEFVVLMAKMTKDTNYEAELKEAFRAFDRENLGYINSDELRYAMVKLHDQVTETEVDEIIREVDCNRDGTITFEVSSIKPESSLQVDLEKIPFQTFMEHTTYEKTAEFVKMMTGVSLNELLVQEKTKREIIENQIKKPII